MRVYFEYQGPIPWVDLGCWVHAKTILFQNMVILHVELKEMKLDKMLTNILPLLTPSTLGSAVAQW